LIERQPRLPVNAEELRRSIETQSEVVERIEFLIGPRGSLATMHAKLASLSAIEPSEKP
jgi:hypothetical protein